MGKIVAIVVALIVLAFIVLVAVLDRPKPTTEMTDQDVKLYRDAAKILNRLVNVIDLSGHISEDIVSEHTRQQIETWLANYRKTLNK